MPVHPRSQSLRLIALQLGEKSTNNLPATITTNVAKQLPRLQHTLPAAHFVACCSQAKKRDVKKGK